MKFDMTTYFRSGTNVKYDKSEVITRTVKLDLHCGYRIVVS